jgi:hypothetical protein
LGNGLREESTMREHFPWERGLSQEAFDRALLLLGLLPPSSARWDAIPDPDRIADLLANKWRTLAGRPWPWRLRDPTRQLIETRAEARRLAAAVDGLISAVRRSASPENPGLRIEANPDPDLDPVELAAALRGAGADSVYLRLRDEGDTTWSWPLRIALPSGSRLLSDIGPDSSLRRLYAELRAEDAAVRSNLLWFEESLAAAAEWVAKRGLPPKADAVVAFGGLEPSGPAARESVARLRKATGAQAVVALNAADPATARRVAPELIANLSHGLPLDAAAGWLDRQYGVTGCTWATRRVAETSAVREQGRIMAKRLQQMRGGRVRLDPDILTRLGRAGRGGRGGRGTRAEPPGPGGTFGRESEPSAARWVSASDLGSALARRLEPPGEGAAPPEEPPLEFHAESDGATTLAALATAAAAERDADRQRHENRFLQARVETPAGRTLGESAPLRAGRDYQTSVFIGAPRKEWLGLEKPLDEPPQPPDGTPLTLHVLFWEPTASPTPQIAPLLLRPVGDTEPVAFPFSIRPEQRTFSARIAVYHRNRNLQTGRLRGRIGEGSAGLTFTVDAAPLPQFIGLGHRTGVGASIILNDDDDGTMRAFAYADGAAGVGAVSDAKDDPGVAVDPSAHGLEQLTAVLGRAVGLITANPDAYTGTTTEGSRQLLLDLALHGSGLLTRLRKHTGMGDKFDQASHIQIVAAHVDALFPVEYLYSGEPPEDDARVCRDEAAARQALESGTCCGAYAGNPTGTICPLRFWSLCKVIERHAHLPEHSGQQGAFRLRSAAVSARDRLLDPLRSAVLAASLEANTAVPTTVSDLRTRLDATLQRHPVPLATDWRSWATEIANTRPTLLVLLPHHLQQGGYDQLEIGGDARKSLQIRAEHLRAPDDQTTRPIVLLIGCQTGSAKIDLEGFVPVFQDAGAVIVVSTIATILGRHAGPAAATIAEEVKRREGDPNGTFGSVMLAVRRQLLAQGTPMVLGLTSYGDADWRIGGPPGPDT